MRAGGSLLLLGWPKGPDEGREGVREKDPNPINWGQNPVLSEDGTGGKGTHYFQKDSRNRRKGKSQIICINCDTGISKERDEGGGDNRLLPIKAPREERDKDGKDCEKKLK